MHPLAPHSVCISAGTVCAVAHHIPGDTGSGEDDCRGPLAYAVGLLSVLLPATVAVCSRTVNVADVLALLWLSAGSAVARHAAAVVV